VAKFLSTDWKVIVNNTDLSRWADSVDTPQEKDQVDVSGFGGTREFLPGIEDSTLTVEFIQDFGTLGPHQTLYPLFSAGTTFVVYVQPVRSAGTSVTNPVYGGTASAYTYNGGAAALNDAAKFTQDFKPATGARFTWGTTAP
jgi:hypothetical protein